MSVLSATLVFFWHAPVSQPFEQLKYFLPLHTILETVSVVMAAMIFAVGWHAYVPSRAMNVVLIACGFLAVALLDVGHFMSYIGMPDFVTPGSTSKSIDFWLAARLISALVLLSAISIGWKPFSTARTRYLIATICAAYATLAYWLILFHADLLPDTFIPGTGLTPFKVIAEYVIVLLNIVSAVLLFLFMGNSIADNGYARN
ncbi:MAG: MASE3 domain-containing protein, partial [Sulfuriferula sp.]